MQSTITQRAERTLRFGVESDLPRTYRGDWRAGGALAFSDVLLAFVVLAPALMPWVLSGQGLPVWPLLWVALWVGLRGLSGLYPGYGLDQVEELRRQSYASAAAIFAALFLAVASPSEAGISPLVSFATLLFVAPLARYFVKVGIRRAGMWGRPVVIIGAGEPGARLIGVLRRKWQMGLCPVGVFDVKAVPPEGEVEGVPYGGGLEEALVVGRKRGIGTAIFAMPHTRREDVAPLVARASNVFRSVVVMPNLGGITNSAVVARDFSGSLGVEIRHNLLDPWSRRTKRALDLFGVVVGGLLISPLLLAIAVLIKLDSRGPAFYGHRRLGEGGLHFRCWKLRTMHPDADRILDEHLEANPELRQEWEESFKLRDDPRITRVGRFLRKSSLDELPQLWNVLRGEMSLVGPRPIVDSEIERYGGIYELYRRIQPGISGFWQVSGRSDTSYTERVGLDSHYVRNWSVWLDLIILVRTVHSVLFSRGAY